MKRSNKCFGVLSVLFTIFGLSFAVSSDTNALKYTRTDIPYFSPTANIRGQNYALSSPLNVVFTNAHDGLSSAQITAPWAFTAHKSGDQCVYGHGSENGVDFYNFKVYGNTEITIGGWPMFVASSENSAMSQCLTLGSGAEFPGFGNSGIPSFSPSSIPLTGSPFMYNFRSFLPYNYDYATWSLHYDGDGDGSLGDNYVINDFDLFSMPLDEISSLDIPLSFDTRNIGNLTAGRSLSFQGRFTFYGQSDDPVTDYMTIKLNTNFGRYSNNTLIFDTNQTTCSFRKQSGSADSAPLLFYTCDLTLPYDIPENYIGFTLHLSSSSTGHSIIDADCSSSTGCWGLSYFYLVTDNDNTPSDTNIDYEKSGFSQDNAPGNPGFYEIYEPSDILSNLFNFSFANPFAPLFGLFTDSSSCVNIPTIASMLHSESTTYCPWFDSTTRNILTPVLGIAGNMLLFGFIVHWVNSRSGNFVVDSGKGEKK